MSSIASNYLSKQEIAGAIGYFDDLITIQRKTRLQQVLNLRTKHITIALENIYQAHNMSAVIRSCECFGTQNLHIIEQSNDFKVDPEIAMGSTKWIDIHHHTNTAQCITQLKQQGYQIAALTLADNAIPLDKLSIQSKTVLCIGTEKTGLSQTAHEMADVQVHVPMVGFTDSLNLSVTAAILLHTLTNTLRKQHNSLWQLSKDEANEIYLRWLVQSIPNGDKMLSHFLASLRNKS